ncbi:MAG: hypothetical protein ACW975_13955 [Candidatus Thorarchaeota archaeon]
MTRPRLRSRHFPDIIVVDVAYSYHWNPIQYSVGFVTYKTTRIIKTI